ncbi:hypothetical protein HHK36_005494 [Tetracentron sinense]|uniref:Apple domain-containing protein n=1 Tax=Tetracentron sinense TaxID=13715 RepID=A0A834ZQG0_TETSI|nr:hypothetical protein HHK36_005494 [Tetracentron sinense]
MKLPANSRPFAGKSMTLKECEAVCRKNCSCTAYANSDITGGGTGCMIWTGELMDLREYTQNGQDLYVRVVASELDTSKDVWTTLNYAFSHSQEREFHLEQKLQHLRKGTSHLPDYLREFKTICDDLAAIGKPIDDRRKVFWLLNGLGHEYKSFVTTMLKPPTPSYKEILPLLQSHEAWTTIHDSENMTQSVAFMGQCNNNRRNSFNKKHKFNQAYTPDDIPKALAAIQIGDSQDDAWFLDTGASAHMISDPGKLIDFHAYYGNDTFMIGDGYTLKITHTGDAILDTKSGNFKLRNVLLAPELKKKLFSVSQFTSDYPCVFEFVDGDFVVKDRNTRNIVMEGTRKGDLYALNALKLQAFFSNWN